MKFRLNYLLVEALIFYIRSPAVKANKPSKFSAATKASREAKQP